MASATRNSLSSRILAISASIFALSACVHFGRTPATPVDPEGQNWTDLERYRWYRGSQGSRLIPEKWLMALEAPRSTTLFMDPAYFARFNYLPAGVSPAPSGRSSRRCPSAGPSDAALPIGFARDCQSDENLSVTRLRWYRGQRDRESWIGLNCAACHTTQINYRGTSLVVDGAPTLADFQGFTDSLRETMQETFDDSSKWERFAARVVAPRRPREANDTRVSADRESLRAAFGSLLDHQNYLAAFNRTNVVYGHGRLDAVGHILNTVALLNDDPAPIRGEPNAPVSYPFIWNAPQHDFVQWNGLVPNQKIRIGREDLDIGALARNTSEVIGVFADVRTRPRAGLGGYRSSVDVGNLTEMEDQLARLMSPKWPAALGTPDPQQVAHGRRLFNQSCASCHASLRRDDLETPIVAQMTPLWGPAARLGTDPWMACNTYSYQARGGLLTGTRAQIAGGDRLPALAATQEYLATQAIGVLLQKKFRILLEAVRRAIGGEGRIQVFERESAIDRLQPADQPLSPAQRLQACIDAANAPAPTATAARTLAYKARPLNGIWATAPYLHNGSVRSLYDLLLPPGQRPTSFWVGNREFDPVHVGFVSVAQGPGSWFRTTDEGGNSNRGHDYGNSNFNEVDRMALIAYMKTL